VDVVKVALVGPNNLFLQGLRHLLDPAQFAVAEEARDLASWQARHEPADARNAAPDLLVADLNGGCSEADLDGLGALRARRADLRIVVLANELSLAEMARLLKAGIDGYLLKDLSAEALSLSLLLVMQGEKALPSSLAGVLAEELRPSANGTASLPRKHLTEREEQILRCLLNAYSNKHIARALNISEGTVKVHLKSLMKKISAGNRTQAALWARNNGIADGELAAGYP
jgi:two-component system nitrate/nitrite response regulator NarL